LKHTKKVPSVILSEEVQDYFFADRTLVLYFGSPLDSRHVKSTYDLRIDCRWRLDDGKKIVAAYWDDAAGAKPALEGLKGSTVNDIEHQEVSHDLKLKFSNGLRLSIFAHSITDKQWELRGVNGYCYGIGPNLTPYERKQEEGDNVSTIKDLD
jgi:hypothetical protein